MTTVSTTDAAAYTVSEREERVDSALHARSQPARVRPLLAGTGILAWLAVAATTALPDSPALPPRDAQRMVDGTPATAIAAVTVVLLASAVWITAVSPWPAAAWARHTLSHGSAWLIGSAVWALVWILSTAKTALLPPPYLVAPQEIIAELGASGPLLAESLGNSLLLLGVGFATGLVAGLVTGAVIGWFQAANYWVHPLLIFLGPVPALAWVPIVFVLFPSTYSGAVFMIALSVWFPVTVLTRAGILSVPRSYFDVAQTLGAKGTFLVFRVALPAALPSIFTGAFMALGASFVSLTVAENFGVNSGLGWFLNWKKSWGDFPGLYAGIVVLVAVCGILLTLLFRVRNHVLRWEKELTRW